MAKQRVSKAPEERRAELIAAARDLFDKNGVDKTRISDIVRHVGVAQGVFYYYFASKEEIVEVVVDEVAGELRDDIQAVMQEDGADFCKKLSGLLLLYLGLVDQFTGDDVSSLTPLAKGFYEKGAPAEKTRGILMTQIRQLVEEGAARGEVTARYPDWTVRVLEAGLLWEATHHLPTREIVFALTEQALGLPSGGLVQYVLLHPNGEESPM